MLSAEKVAAQELERKQIATELHDSVGSSLGSIIFGVDAALARAKKAGHDTVLVELLDLVSTQTRAVLAEVRRISLGLRPASLDDLGLISTLSWLIREFRAVHASISIVAEIGLEESEIQSALRTPMFRIVQEAVHNAVKHAQARKIGISLGRRGKEICLEIFDDGVGFDLQSVGKGEGSSGIGLRGMADRITISGGDFQLDSAPGKGTRIVACWPMSFRPELETKGAPGARASKSDRRAQSSTKSGER
jgi:signal transduction histidine kinase